LGVAWRRSDADALIPKAEEALDDPMKKSLTFQNYHEDKRQSVR
jgi:hypothetical protein